MKKNVCILVSAILLLGFVSCKTMARSSENVHDWAGIYTGVIPAADVEGINVKINLKADKTYIVEYHYIGKSDADFIHNGKFTLNTAGDTVILDKERKDDFPNLYKLGKNTLTQLDLEGNIITGELANNYILKKQQ